MAKELPTIGLLMGIYNEEKRIAECLNWHAPYFQEISIAVQKSDDKTFEICQEYEKKATVPFYLRAYPKVGFSEKFLQATADLLKTDWILYCDADEKFPKEFLEQMRELVNQSFYNGFRFERDNWFDIQVFNEAVPIDPKVIRVKHPTRDPQVRLTRKSLSVFPPQVHVRVRVRGPDGDEKIGNLPFTMFHLKSFDEQWIDNKAYKPEVERVERFEQAKREARAKGLPIDKIKLEDY